MSLREQLTSTNFGGGQPVPEWQLPVIGKSPEEIAEWATHNTALAKTAFEATLGPLQEAVGRRNRPSQEEEKTREVFYIPASASSDEATALRNTAIKLLDYTFAEKDWTEGEASKTYDPLNDGMTFVAEHKKDGSVQPRSAMHFTFRPAPGILMPAEQAMVTDWGQDPVDVYNHAERAGLYQTKGLVEKIIDSKKVLEVYTIGTLPEFKSSGDAIAQMGLTCVRTMVDEGIEAYLCVVDGGLGGMLGRKNDGWQELPGLPSMNFHSNNPEGNNSTVRLCMAREWRKRLLDPKSASFEPQHYTRFWTLDGYGLTSVQQTIVK